MILTFSWLQEFHIFLNAALLIVSVSNRHAALKASVSTEQLYNSVIMMVVAFLRFKKLFHSDACLSPIRLCTGSQETTSTQPYWTLLSSQLNAIQLF